MTSSNPRKASSAIALVASGLVAGGVLAGAMTASAADDPTPAPSQSSGERPDRPAETPLTGEALEKVKAAVLAKYPGATLYRVETDSDGAYEAHITKADGTRVTVELDKSYTITGEEAGGPGRKGGPGGRHGGPRFEGTAASADQLAKIKASVTKKYPGATVDRAAALDDGTFRALVTKKDGTRVGIALDKSYVITAEKTGRPGGRGPGGPGGVDRGTPATADQLAKIKAAVTKKYSGATVDRAFVGADGTFHAHVVKADGTHLHVDLNKSYAIVMEHTRRGPGPGGPPPAAPSSSGTTQNS